MPGWILNKNQNTLRVINFKSTDSMYGSENRLKFHFAERKVSAQNSRCDVRWDVGRQCEVIFHSWNTLKRYQKEGLGYLEGLFSCRTVLCKPVLLILINGMKRGMLCKIKIQLRAWRIRFGWWGWCGAVWWKSVKCFMFDWWLWLNFKLKITLFYFFSRYI